VGMVCQAMTKDTPKHKTPVFAFDPDSGRGIDPKILDRFTLIPRNPQTGVQAMTKLFRMYVGTDGRVQIEITAGDATVSAVVPAHYLIKVLNGREITESVPGGVEVYAPKAKEPTP